MAAASPGIMSAFKVQRKERGSYICPAFIRKENIFPETISHTSHWPTLSHITIPNYKEGLQSEEQDWGWAHCHPKKNWCSVSQEEVGMEMGEALIMLIIEK